LDFEKVLTTSKEGTLTPLKKRWAISKTFQFRLKTYFFDTSSSH
jgi:hypothetical protein